MFRDIVLHVLKHAFDFHSFNKRSLKLISLKKFETLKCIILNLKQLIQACKKDIKVDTFFHGTKIILSKTSYFYTFINVNV